MKKFGVLLCVMLCVPMFAFKANNEEQIILTVQYERPDKGHGGLHRTSVRHLYLIVKVGLLKSIKMKRCFIGRPYVTMELL